MRNKKKSKKKTSISLTATFSLVVFAILSATILLTILLASIASWVGWVDVEQLGGAELQLYLYMIALASIIIGFGVAFFVMHMQMKPVNYLIAQMNRLAGGDFKARITFSKAIDEIPAFHNVSESFNKMAQELESTEMLRSDFINNFSHEFKTPIVSIAGFAKLLKRADLTQEQKAEYIRIIEEESLRLSDMANSVLNLTKIENQSILTDVSQFNLSEQIRASVLLLENKWEQKNIEISMDLPEYGIRANEELLKQVWINLLDNAIKFAPEGGLVEIGVQQREKTLQASISDNGIPIAPEHMDKIFNKFYQAEESHSGVGNGVGLAVVKRIVQLHQGSVCVQSDEKKTTFTVELPIEQ